MSFPGELTTEEKKLILWLIQGAFDWWSFSPEKESALWQLRSRLARELYPAPVIDSPGEGGITHPEVRDGFDAHMEMEVEIS
jgi:hypothetical protein